MKKWMLSAMLVGLLAACGSQPTKGGGQAAPILEKSQTSESGSAATRAIQGNALASSALEDPKNILSHRSIYYDFGNAIVKDEYRPLIKAHSEYLIAHPSARVQLQGNCDERGSREYNLALGERRADSVKQLMEAAGVPASQIATISYGSEKPKALGHNEEAWVQNRRTDIVYLSE